MAIQKKKKTHSRTPGSLILKIKELK